MSAEPTSPTNVNVVGSRHKAYRAVYDQLTRGQIPSPDQIESLKEANNGRIHSALLPKYRKAIADHKKRKAAELAAAAMPPKKITKAPVRSFTALEAASQPAVESLAALESTARPALPSLAVVEQMAIRNAPLSPELEIIPRPSTSGPKTFNEIEYHAFPQGLRAISIATDAVADLHQARHLLQRYATLFGNVTEHEEFTELMKSRDYDSRLYGPQRFFRAGGYDHQTIIVTDPTVSELAV